MKSRRVFWLTTLVLVLISLGSAFGRREEPASGNVTVGSGHTRENRQGSQGRGVSLDSFSSSKHRVPNASDPLHNRCSCVSKTWNPALGGGVHPALAHCRLRRREAQIRGNRAGRVPAAAPGSWIGEGRGSPVTVADVRFWYSEVSFGSELCY
ncbi:hypothetical protein MLD38_000948 [Melastoma candidum]|uniref:Uncharacterized protein n=1 Tax=Melastoma candidum TaxID=119954 RepID=A0ACB9SB01_9MYRT|nr:hypothetical protein MLD38_000948 [Melastoma candidum]